MFGGLSVKTLLKGTIFFANLPKPGSLFYGAESNKKRNVTYQLMKLKQKSEEKESGESEDKESESDVAPANVEEDVNGALGGEGLAERQGGEGGQKRGRGSGKRKRRGFRRGKTGSKSRGLEDLQRAKRKDAKITAVDKALEILDNPYDTMNITEKKKHA